MNNIVTIDQIQRLGDLDNKIFQLPKIVLDLVNKCFVEHLSVIKYKYYSIVPLTINRLALQLKETRP